MHPLRLLHPCLFLLTVERHLCAVQVAWSDVTRLDSAKLADKGILKLFYRDAAGEEKRLVLDSWRLRNFRELVKLVESKVDAAPAEEEAEEAEEEEAEDR